ncbi:hypothetical protein Tco_0569689 [Tanacetum coccineum]
MLSGPGQQISGKSRAKYSRTCNAGAESVGVSDCNKVYKEAGNEAVMSISVDDYEDVLALDLRLDGSAHWHHGLQEVYKKLGGIWIGELSGFSSLGRSREVFQLTQVCGSRDAFPSLVVPLVHLSLPLVSLSFQPRTYNLSTLPFRDSMQIAENDLVVKKFPENDLVVKKFPENDFEVLTVQEKHPST